MRLHVLALTWLLFLAMGDAGRAEGLPPGAVPWTNGAVQSTGPLIGIGVLLRTCAGYAEATRLVPGGAAEADGRLKVGDRIVAIAQEHETPANVIGMDLLQIVHLIRGPQGSRVTLMVIPPAGGPDASRREIGLVRAPVKLAAPVVPAAP
jgi:C-terminal processing protease CtpA/Prc